MRTKTQSGSGGWSTQGYIWWNRSYTTAMELTITPRVEALLEAELKSGRFQDSNHLIEIALLALADARQFDHIQFNAKIQEGLDDIERGDVFSED